MKKLLAILAAVGLTATTSSVVISCTTTVDRFGKLNFSDKQVYTSFILKMKDSGFISVSQAEKFLKISDTEIIADVLKILDKKIAEEEYKTTSSNIASTLKVKEKETTENITSNLLNDLATNKFFSEYTAKVISDKHGLVNDKQYSNNHSLNPFNLFEDDEKINYSIYYKEKSENETLTRWQVLGEFGENEWNIPSIEALNGGNNFYIIGSADNTKVTKLTDTKNTKVLNKDTKIDEVTGPFLVAKNEQEQGFSGNEIMKYRFQSYINAKIIPDLYTQLISLAYLDSNLYSTNLTTTNYTRSFVRLNTSNKLVSSVQNSLTSETKSSNVKLIWSFKAKVSTDATSWVKSYKQALGEPNSSGNIILDENSITTLKNNFSSNSLENNTKLGTDPFLGLVGYNGIAKNNDTGIEAISGSLSISTDAQTAAKSIDRPTLLTGPRDQGFAVGDNGESEIVLVLPIYLNDIYDNSNVTLNAVNQVATLSIPSDTWVPLGDKYSPYVDDMKTFTNETNVEIIKDNNGNLYVKALADKGSFTLGNQRTITVNVENANDTMLGIHETINKEDSAFTSGFDTEQQGKVKDTDKILYSVLWARNADPKSVYQLSEAWSNSVQSSSDIKNLSATNKQLLISEIENGLVAGDTDYTTEAKEELYTKYIMDGDNVLFQGLYDELAKYIKDEDGNTSD
ncbi:unknown lipoprotein [Mesoplasma florum L1]|uniref:Lipoprotein n=1 Tax=Mesoplasma florum (strain ATCC 33453 / NBRC 100688 / NCTC 11704 / L1) TaxID=265311 RepID=Q6F1M0_MESFL|nr:lipoprotein [Mesoplasma florum]AAT75603.1 unknown lipoprotein [Mesoplasma florum L1]